MTASNAMRRNERKNVSPRCVNGGVAIVTESLCAGPALDRGSRLPAEVAAEVERRCPRFLGANINAREQDSSSGASEDWPCLMLWIVDHFFQDAKAQGWFYAILIHL